MKKQLLSGAFAALALVAVSCSGGADHQTLNYDIDLANLVTDSQNGNTEITDATYAFLFDYTNSEMQMRISNLNIDGKRLNFLSPEDVKFTESTYAQGLVTKFALPSMSALSSATTATDLSGEISTAYNYNPVLNLITNVWRRFVISYKIDNRYTVQTFEKSTFWKGSTVTSYVMGNTHKEFTTSAPVYSVDMDLENMTATVIIYNAQFAQEMPTVSIMKIEGLKVTCSAGKYSVAGSDMVPQVYEGGAWTPNTKFTFNNFTLTTTNSSLTSGSASFTVAGMFQGAATLVSTL